ncbi:bifunctional Delta(1)-pyrroline-2-carboxylate/Delta(1)-piperideine-2-carboxylate reductase [Curvivirga aplysinae]|uniref:ornithine cyclodeaminase family protein n=1 Tax=Curvivirga aplysinae TaxID=2529852 RepID=UPI002E256DC6|nr:ornithine cyclodeaminase family protein [Curvivirga aplysinae]
MKILDEAQTRDALPWKELVEALRDMFEAGCEMPVRHHHDMEVPGETDATLLLMPAWSPGNYVGVKVVSVFPGNMERGLPAIYGNYMLSSGKTGEMLALIDGGELTARRTAAASALAADYLAKKDAKILTIVGTGRLAVNLAQAHSSIRNIEKIQIWGRTFEKAQDLAATLVAQGMPAVGIEDLQEAVETADIVSCCTLSSNPLVKGEWLKEGTHLDLVGAFKPTMRESDDEAIRRASVFVDTVDGATKEGGDIVQPIADQVMTKEDICADLYDLTRGKHKGRQNDNEITLFKSVGAALEDLAGAILAYEASNQ